MGAWLVVSISKGMSISEHPKPDIEGDIEIRLMVDTFYDKIRTDEKLGPIFQERVDDWSLHMPKMYAFWNTILFGGKDYRGNPMGKHLDLPVDSEHFQQWIRVFGETVDELFEGEKAEQAKAAAKSIAHTFQIRMGINPFGHSDRLL